MDNISIQEATTKKEILDCFPALLELRPQLTKESYIIKIQTMQNSGYHLMYAFNNKENTIPSILGYRIFENLAWGKIFYIDDLSTLPEHRHKGYASKLLEWSIDRARYNDCEQLHLDTSFDTKEAQRLYLKYNFNYSCQHMAIIL
jgi:ribosomal protein S18 acetylase RimI-like enzyme